MYMYVCMYCFALDRESLIVVCITQYGSTVYIGMAMGGSALYPYIRKFQLSLSISIQSATSKKLDENITGGMNYRQT